MSNKIKILRYQAQIMNIINQAIITEVENKIVKHLSVTAVKLSDDLSVAKIYLDCYKRQVINKAIEQVNRLKGFFRSKIAKTLNTFRTPQLVFVSDQSIDYANKIEKLFDQIKKEGE